MATPTDPLYALQWHFGLIGDIETIWDEYTGDGVNVGIYDDGVQYTHPDLAGNYNSALHVVDDNGVAVDPMPVLSTDGHGTSVAGIIAAVDNNGIGGTGIAHGASITGVNIFGASVYGYVNAGTVAGQLAFLHVIHQAAQFDVMSNSWGSTPVFSYASSSLANPNSGDFALQTEYAHVSGTGRGGLGTVIVQAAGNDDLDANGDGTNASRFTATIAATDASGNAASYTNFGQSILVAAPASAVTTDLTGDDGYNFTGETNELPDTDYTQNFGGTSAATPTVSGIVSLMLEANSGLGWRDVQNILATSAKHTGSAIGGAGTGEEDGSWFVNSADNWNGGGMHFHVNYGYGMVDTYAAVRMAEVWNLFEAAKTSANEAMITSSTYTGPDAVPDDGTYFTFTMDFTSSLSIEHVALVMDFDHTFVGDMEILLTSAEGTALTVYASDTVGTSTSFSGAWYFGLDSLLGENAFGTWTVSVTDMFAGADFGTINSAYLQAYGSTISTNDTYHYTFEIFDAILLDPVRETLSDTNGGSDWINAAAINQNLQVNLASDGTGFAKVGGATGNFISIANGTLVENIVTGDGDDTITGNSSANHLVGMRGNDTIDGGAGSDNIEGGAGDDILNGGTGVDTVDGGDGIDTLDLSGATNTQKINLITNVNIGGFANNDTFLNIENVIGSNTRGDDITGTAGANTLSGMGADDILRGFNGDDILEGGENNDFLYGGRGADILNGGNGIDWAMYNDADHGVIVDLGGVGSGGIYADGDTYVSIERVRGSNFDDTITMDGGINKVLGGNGNDVINGLGGKDQLRGGNDNDRINGGADNDTMFGDAGNDIFEFDLGSGADFIADFENDIDSIELDGNLAGGALAGLTAQQVVDTYGIEVSATRIYLDFGNGDVLKIIGTSPIVLADLYDDISVV